MEYVPKKRKNKYTEKKKQDYKISMVISFCFLALTFFFTLIIYSSLYSHDSLYNKHYKVLFSFFRDFLGT